MTDSKTTAQQPVSPTAIIGILLLMCLFGLATVRVYTHHRSSVPQNEAPDNLPEEMAWKATPETRRDALDKLRDREAYQSETYDWVDQKAGVVRLPIERAMELVVQENQDK